MSDPRILVTAGEASSDQHAAGLLRALRATGCRFQAYGVGGPELAAAGVELLADYRELAVVGLVEVLGRLPRILALLQRLKQTIRRAPPALFLPVDSPDFNFRLLPAAAASGVPTVYFIAPQLWAWRPGRVERLRRTVRRLLVLFPFEEAWFRARGVATEYVGHPLVDAARELPSRAAVRAQLGLDAAERVGLLLPGSRTGEVARHGPPMGAALARLEAAGQRMRWLVRRASGLEEAALTAAGLTPAAELRAEPVLALARAADVTIAASGTASFEAALAGTPLIVLYRMHAASWWLARRLVRVPHVAMANLTLGERLLPELLQGACTGERIAAEVGALLDDPRQHERIRRGLQALDARFGPSGAYRRAAAAVCLELERRI